VRKPLSHHTEIINQFLREPIGSPLVRVLFTKGMIAADVLPINPEGIAARADAAT
jgi:hypothetical protein